MNLQELRRLVNSEYRKYIKEARSFSPYEDDPDYVHRPPSRGPSSEFPIHDLPPEDYEREMDKINASAKAAAEDLIKYVMANMINWDRSEVEQAVANRFEQEHLDAVGFQDAHEVADEVFTKVKSEFEKIYEEDAEDPLSIDRFYEELTTAMDDSQYAQLQPDDDY